MDAVRRRFRPALRHPRAVIAFEGWNDACEAATGAAAYLLSRFDGGDQFAIIEPEEFFDFQQHRPVVRIGDGATRELVWPETRFFAVELPDADHDLVVVTGNEPSHRWKTFARTVTRVLNDVGVETAFLLGAYIGEVTHHQPVPLSGVATEPAIVDLHRLDHTDYEGPTGIVGVLLEACKEVGLPALSVWAATPHYLAANPNPSAMLALVRKVADMTGATIDVADLEALDHDFRRRVDEAIGESDDLAGYLRSSGDDAILDPDLTGQLVSEIEKFLRGL